MFENEQDIVAVLLSKDSNFKRLYSRHSELNQEVDAANSRVPTLDEVTLDGKKKQKLYLKDQMAEIISDYKMSSA